MGITAINAVGIVSNRAAACPGGVFNVIVSVTGTAAGRGGSYVASVWDNDWGFDTLLADTPNIVVPAGRFVKRHKLPLKCDPKCNVVGAKGNSGENPANVYGYAESGNLFNRKSGISPVINLTCTLSPPKTVSFLRSGGTIETEIGMIISVPNNAVGADLELVLARSFERPDTEYFAPMVAPQVRAVMLGTPEHVFEVPVTIAWPLDKRMHAFLDELEGMFVRFDAETETWMPIEDVDIGNDHAKFQIMQGGMIGFAPHAKYADVIGPGAILQS